jgi:hypothetical protein
MKLTTSMICAPVIMADKSPADRIGEFGYGASGGFHHIGRL